MAKTNRRWLLKQRPNGALKPTDFEMVEAELKDVDLNPDEILIQNMAFLCAPTMRNWMDPPGNSLYPSIPLGQPIMAPAAGLVVASATDDLPVGSRVLALSSWQDYAVVAGAGLRRPTLLPDGVSYLEGLGRYGLNPMTAYFGLLEVGQPRAQETLVVSGAAGSTGSTVCQIGKIEGLRVIGIAGGKEKCGWLVDECGIDGVIDYKSENIADRLAALCPDGINIFFDNVGGDILQAAIDNMAPFGRVVLCGQIASYDDGESPEGPRNMMRMVYGGIRMQGFLCGHYAARFPEAVAELKKWTTEGKLQYREDLRQGFENLPTSFADLFTGANKGTLLVQVDERASDVS